jgi:hypothetical protein
VNLHSLFEYLKIKLWPKKWLGIKVTIPTTKTHKIKIKWISIKMCNIMLKICFQRPLFFSFGTLQWEPVFVEMNPQFNRTHNLVIFKAEKGIFFQDHLTSQGACNKFTHNMQEFTTNHSSFYHWILFYFCSFTN